MIMLLVNYVESAIEIAIIGIALLDSNIGVKDLLLYTFVGEMLKGRLVQGEEWFVYLNTGIKFFFLTLVFGYFVNQLRQREFRVK